MRYGMVIDLRHCIGCMTCSMACKVENNLPNDVWWNRVETDGGASRDTARGQYPDCTLGYMTVACQHCANPACAEVCPTGATHVEDGGIVAVDWDECIGCQSCIKACPYDVRTLVTEPQYFLDHAVGNSKVPAHVGGVVEKCTFCHQRDLAAGEVPACVEHCLGQCRYFGDLDDPESEVSKLVAEGAAAQYLPENGTEPSVYYIK